MARHSPAMTNANAVYPRSIQEDMYTNSARVKAMVAASHGNNNASVSGILPQSSNYSAFTSAVQPPPPAMSPSLSSASGIIHHPTGIHGGDMHAALSAKLNPSVYSHPNVQDPVLMAPKSYRDHHQFPLHRDLAVLRYILFSKCMFSFTKHYKFRKNYEKTVTNISIFYRHFYVLH